MSADPLEELRRQAGGMCGLYFATLRKRGRIGYCPGCLVRELERRDLVAEYHVESLYRELADRARERAQEPAEEPATR